MPREVVINWGPNQNFVTLLTQAGARFIIAGSTASRFHVPAWPREPGDLDLLFEAAVENGSKLIDAWDRADGPPVTFTAEVFAGPNKQLRDRSTFYLDALTPPADFDFQEAWADAEEAVMMGSDTHVRVASVSTLLRLYRVAHAHASEDAKKYASSIEALEKAERRMVPEGA